MLHMKADRSSSSAFNMMRATANRCKGVGNLTTIFGKLCGAVRGPHLVKPVIQLTQLPISVSKCSRCLEVAKPPSLAVDSRSHPHMHASLGPFTLLIPATKNPSLFQFFFQLTHTLEIISGGATITTGGLVITSGGQTIASDGLKITKVLTGKD